MSPSTRRGRPATGAPRIAADPHRLDQRQRTAGDGQAELERLGDALAAVEAAERRVRTDVAERIDGSLLSTVARLALDPLHRRLVEERALLPVLDLAELRCDAPVVPDVEGDDLLRTRPYRTTVDCYGLIPIDQTAEETLAGISLASAAEARLAQGRLAVEDFHDKRISAVIEAAADPVCDVRDDPSVLAGVLACDYLDNAVLEGRDRRIEAVAAATGHPTAWLRQLLEGRLAAGDPNGWFALRVKVAAVERWRVRVLLAELDRIGVDVAPLLEADARNLWASGLVESAARALGRYVRTGADAAAGETFDALLALGELVGLGGDAIAGALGADTSAGAAA